MPADIDYLNRIRGYASQAGSPRRVLPAMRNTLWQAERDVFAAWIFKNLSVNNLNNVFNDNFAAADSHELIGAFSREESFPGRARAVHLWLSWKELSGPAFPVTAAISLPSPCMGSFGNPGAASVGYYEHEAPDTWIDDWKRNLPMQSSISEPPLLQLTVPPFALPPAAAAKLRRYDDRHRKARR